MKRTLVVMAAALLTFAGSASAALIFLETIDLQGTGVGATDPIVRVTSPGAAAIESGCFGLAPGGAGSTALCGFPDSDVLQTNIVTLADRNIDNADEFSVIFNAIEPGADLGLLLVTFDVRFYDRTTGALLSTHAMPDPMDLDVTFAGQGNAGFIFVLDDPQRAALQGHIDALGAENVVVGSGFLADQVAGGPESVFLFEREVVVPEPAAMLLFGCGLMGLALAVRRGKQHA